MHQPSAHLPAPHPPVLVLDPEDDCPLTQEGAPRDIAQEGPPLPVSGGFPRLVGTWAGRGWFHRTVLVALCVSCTFAPTPCRLPLERFLSDNAVPAVSPGTGTCTFQ